MRYLLVIVMVIAAFSALVPCVDGAEEQCAHSCCAGFLRVTVHRVLSKVLSASAIVATDRHLLAPSWIPASASMGRVDPEGTLILRL